jgi:hypothetical protein
MVKPKPAERPPPPPGPKFPVDKWLKGAGGKGK